jgi:sporulation-control protein spo0M
MNFSEKMQESLGAGGVQIEVRPPADGVQAGERAHAEVVMTGGNRPAHVDALVVRVVEADRHFVDEDGGRLEEEEAQGRPDRHRLTAGWTRRTISEHRVAVNRDLAAGETHDLEIEIEVPDHTRKTTVSCSHMLNVQADIPGQIDPTGNVRINVRG